MTSNLEDRSPAAPPAPGPGRAGRPLRRKGWLALSVAGVVLLGAGVATGWFLQRESAQTPNSYDVGYLQDMTEHHAQAVAMSLTVLDRETSPGTREAARRILLSQQADVGLMQGWLQAWGEPEQGAHPMAWMTAAGHDHDPSTPGADDGTMPGAVSSAQMSELASAPDGEVETLFIDLMTAHHEGALTMATVARDRARTDDVRGLATRTVTAQELEIAQLQGLRGLLAASR